MWSLSHPRHRINYSCRHVIEHIFGVIKCCFRILLLPLKYSIGTQSLIPVALSVIHNFITSHNESENVNNNNIVQDWTDSVEWGDGVGEETSDGSEETGDEEIGSEAHEKEVVAEDIDPIDMKDLRDAIAEAMWKDYQAHLETQH